MTKYQRKKLKKLLGEACRLRDGNKCLKCGKTSPLHTSHIYPVGKEKRMEFMLENVKTLCNSCHLYWWHKHPVAANEWLKTVIPADRLKRLKEASKTNLGLKKKYDYEEIKAELEGELRRLQQED